MQQLAKLFGSQAKVKIMRLFLFNQDSSYDLVDISRRSLVTNAEANREVANLLQAGLLKKKNFSKSFEVKKGKSVKIIRKKTWGFILNNRFQYLVSLQNFLLRVSPIKEKDIIEKISKVGKIKLLVLAGVFIQDLESRVDILIVGDNLRRGALESVIRSIESEIGKEMKYASFETNDFRYRVGMYDKLVRDILDYPHETIIDKLGVSAEVSR